MDDGPPEIWSKTRSFACTDDGRTGRSLSLVSCSFNTILKPYKLQSVAVVGRTQLLAFAALLERTPPLLRRVICIYLFYYQGLRGTSLEEIEEEHVEVCHAVECILTAIVPSVRVLHKWVAPPLQYGLPGFVHLKLPVLEELVEPRPPHTPPAWNADADIELTALRYLNLMYSMRHPLQDLAWYLAQMPNVTHLSFRCELNEKTLDALANKLRTQYGLPVLPNCLERLYIHDNLLGINDDLNDFWVLGFYNYAMQLLKDFEETNRRVVLMP